MPSQATGTDSPTRSNREQLFGQVDASAFFGSEGLKLSGYWGRGNSLSGGALAGTGFVGDYTIAGFALSYPLIRSRRLNLSPDVAFDYYDSTVDVNGTAGLPTELNSSHLRIVRPGVSLDFQDAVLADLPAANLEILNVSQGLPRPRREQQPGSDAGEGRRAKRLHQVRGRVHRVQNLVTFGEVSTALKLSAAGGQYTSDILPPSEKFFCCGLRWSRGYFYGQVTGDRGVGTTAELQFNTGFIDVPILAVDHRLDVQILRLLRFRPVL